MKKYRWLLMALGAMALVTSAIWEFRGKQISAWRAPVEAKPAATVVGSAACGKCHASEWSLWRGSHHERAMQHATRDTVLGDFANAHFEYSGVESTFFVREQKFRVRTDGPDGALGDFEIKFTFGVYPLQQYLVELPGGRLQALSIFWDARPRSEGGQRWAHLYPTEHIVAGDPLHWTGRQHNWNSMCAACHSTGLRKNFDLAANRFATTWQEINVACEACHGAGSLHVRWASQAKGDSVSAPAAGDTAKSKGFSLALGAAHSGAWAFSPDGKPIAHFSGTSGSGDRMEVCSPCHSRRSQLTEPAAQGTAAFLNSYAPTVLESGLYHADGQIHDEVYEYGSFQQSKMFAKGVMCSDCHEPHSLELRGGVEHVCTQCHLPSTFDVPTHHHHATAERAPLCVDCHMPQRTYMVVDARRDHSIRIPRPDLSVSHGVPNACGSCHANKGPKWAADAIVRWYGSKSRPLPALLVSRETDPIEAPRSAAQGLMDRELPAIVRATLATALEEHLDQQALESLRYALGDPQPLVRASAIKSLQSLAAEERSALLMPLIRDPVRLVRIEAARGLADVPIVSLSSTERAARQSAERELLDAEWANAERPEAHLNLANYYARSGQLADAESALRTASRLDPNFIPAYVNLADVYRAQGRDAEGEPLLQEALRRAPRSAVALHALGLLKARQGDLPAALASLRAATRAEPTNAQYGYVYAIGLSSAGQPAAALTELERVNRVAPADESILYALATLQRDQGHLPAAKRWADRLTRLHPGSERAQLLQRSLTNDP